LIHTASKVVAFAALLGALASACSNSQPVASVPASCAVHGSHAKLVAANIRFVQRCLGVVADRPFDIDFVNQDANIAHNVVIYESSGNAFTGRKVFNGKVTTGDVETTYHVQGLPAGSYLFRCAVHPLQMVGRLTVGPA
jgi:plastocyanin